MGVLSSADRRDFSEISKLVNAAYRGGEHGVGWTHEQHLVDGPRTSPEDLERELTTGDPALILCLREEEAGPIRACVLLRRHADHCYLGMLSVAPEAQDRGYGRAMLEHSETQAREWGLNRVAMTVLDVRDSLLDWYERRGYRRTGMTIPFPYDNKSLGRPRLDDLTFVVLEKYLSHFES